MGLTTFTQFEEWKSCELISLPLGPPLPAGSGLQHIDILEEIDILTSTVENSDGESNMHGAQDYY